MTVSPRLEVFQALWAMQRSLTHGFARSHEENFAMIAEAGYDGVCIELGPVDVATARSFRPLIERHRLGVSINVLPDRMAQYREALTLARELEARLLNVICLITPVEVAGAIPVILKMMELADEAGVEMHLETHRNSITNDMFAMLQILDAIPDLKIAADLSHYVTAREFYLPLSSRIQSQVHRILDRAESFQGRIASNQQIQLPLDFPQSRPWIDLFLGWWETGFRLWRAHRAERGGDVLNFLCELGPPEYAMTDRNGDELSDRWQEAKIMRDYALSIWRKLDSEEVGLTG
jgi:hypothetical protein